ncbi:MAG: hypothetical protein KGI58_03540 [Patescibacteria group bacterium]|nr:hypothetical protein [Patescibacteria group bacterium]
MSKNKIKITHNKGFIVSKEWFNDSWCYKAKKYSINLLGMWIPGWNEEGGILMKVEYFKTIDEALKYVETIKNNYINK